MLYWSNPFPIYDATYIFRVLPKGPKNMGFNYWTTFFWGNNGDFSWDPQRGANTYYGAHPYPYSGFSSASGQNWEISVYARDIGPLDPNPNNGAQVQWNRWYTQAFRAWRESTTTTHHEFYYDLPDTSKVIRYTVNDANWATRNPPNPAIVMGQAPDLGGTSWGGYPGWEEFQGVIRGLQFYAGNLSVADILSELNTPKSTAAGASLIWYLNLNPRPSDVNDRKGVGTPHNPAWSGTTASEWSQ